MTDDDSDIYAEVDQDMMDHMGDFCVATGYTPAQYWDMTGEECNAILRAFERKNKAQKG